jgi:8-amino-7-oxononanoate synthase
VTYLRPDGLKSDNKTCNSCGSVSGCHPYLSDQLCRTIPILNSDALFHSRCHPTVRSYDFQCSSKHKALVKHLFGLSAYLQAALLAHGHVVLTFEVTRSPIVPVKMPNPRPVASWLRVVRFAVVPLTFPNVPRGTERLRICVHAGNTYQEVDALVSALTSWKAQNPAVEEGLHMRSKL